METKNLKITKEDANNLLQIMNIAVKTAGLEGGVANFALKIAIQIEKLFGVKEDPIPTEKPIKKVTK